MRNTESNKNKFKIMRALKYLFLLTIFMATKSFSQVATNYTFSQSTGTYAAITGTAIHTAAWDNAVVSVTIPFTFIFNGTNYTTCNVSTNGFITFGSTAPSIANYSPIRKCLNCFSERIVKSSYYTIPGV